VEFQGIIVSDRSVY